MADLEKIGPALKRLRISKGLSQRELGRQLGLVSSTMARFESDDSNPRWSGVLRYLQALDCSLDDLVFALGGHSPRSPEDAFEVAREEIDKAIEEAAERTRERLKDRP